MTCSICPLGRSKAVLPSVTQTPRGPRAFQDRRRCLLFPTSMGTSVAYTQNARLSCSPDSKPKSFVGPERAVGHERNGLLADNVFVRPADHDAVLSLDPHPGHLRGSIDLYCHMCAREGARSETENLAATVCIWCVRIQLQVGGDGPGQQIVSPR